MNQFLRRAAAEAYRQRRSSNHSEELTLKRHRPDNGILGNNNSPDAANHMSQITATDFSTNAKHANNNNNTPPLLKDDRERERERDRNDNGLFFRLAIFCLCILIKQIVIGFVANITSNNNGNTNGNGLSTSSSTTDKDSLTPSPPIARMNNDDVKSEPMELVCSANNPSPDDRSNDSIPDNEMNHSVGDGKGSLR